MRNFVQGTSLPANVRFANLLECWGLPFASGQPASKCAIRKSARRSSLPANVRFANLLDVPGVAICESQANCIRQSDESLSALQVHTNYVLFYALMRSMLVCRLGMCEIATKSAKANCIRQPGESAKRWSVGSPGTLQVCALLCADVIHVGLQAWHVRNRHEIAEGNIDSPDRRIRQTVKCLHLEVRKH
jgi:hypothetical protein